MIAIAQLASKLLALMQIMTYAQAIKDEIFDDLFNRPIKLNSSFIDTAEFNSSNEKMLIKFKDGKSKTYETSLNTFLELVTASSPGVYYNANIRD